MLPSIDLNDDASFQAGEIRNVRPQRMLSTETVSVQPASFQDLPELALGNRHLPAQLPRPFAFGAIAHSHSLRVSPYRV